MSRPEKNSSGADVWGVCIAFLLLFSTIVLTAATIANKNLFVCAAIVSIVNLIAWFIIALYGSIRYRKQKKSYSPELPNVPVLWSLTAVSLLIVLATFYFSLV